MSENEDFVFPERDFVGAVGSGEEQLIQTIGRENYEAMRQRQADNHEAEMALHFAQARKLDGQGFFWTALGCAIQKLFELETVDE